MANFAVAYPVLKPLEGSVVGAKTYKSVYQRLFLTLRNLASSFIIVKNDAMMNVLWV